jgi:pyruvate/2-oxoglutarate dehydrogenase complex dihydrolipoamide acyltransferase (E2) component
MERLSKFDEQSEVVEWLKSPGDPVEVGEPLVTVLSDKATVEIPAPDSGILVEIAVPSGSSVPAGTVLAWIGQPGEAPTAAEPAIGEAAVAPPPVAPASSAGTTGTPRPPVSPGRVNAVPAARRLAKALDVALETLAGTGPGGIITARDVEQAAATEATTAPEPTQEAGQARRRRITPVALKLARAHGLEPVIDELEGTGPGGEVVKADVEELIEARRRQPGPEAAPERDVSPQAPHDTLLPLQGVQRTMARRMSVSHQKIVQATTVADVDMTGVVSLRERIPASFTAFVVKAAARAVPEFPLVNASLEEDTIRVKKHVDMGVAVATEAGLIVPVVRHAGTKTLAEIHYELEALSERARNQALKAEDLGEPTMTVTNSGVFGSLLFTPMVVAPQSTTMGMGKVAPTPVVREDRMVIRQIMYLSLSYDHRFLDGSVAVRYLQQVRASLEDPLSLLWDEEA